jgi:hypothetical protein
MEDNKIININGTNNRYQIKKLINRNPEKKNRAIFNNLNINEELLFHETQLKLLKMINDNNNNDNNDNNDNYDNNNNNIKIITNEIQKKINSYKQQDIEKKLLCIDKFINLNDIINGLIKCDMKCYYCKCDIFIIYKIVRENKQWSVDRINNDLGHNIDNYVISCLECNLKRRRKCSDKFLFTKQLNINKISKQDNIVI